MEKVMEGRFFAAFFKNTAFTGEISLSITALISSAN